MSAIEFDRVGPCFRGEHARAMPRLTQIIVPSRATACEGRRSCGKAFAEQASPRALSCDTSQDLHLMQDFETKASILLQTHTIEHDLVPPLDDALRGAL